MRSMMRWAVCWSALGLMANCRLAEQAGLTSDTSKDATVDLILEQQKLLRFADGFLTSMILVIEQLRHDAEGMEPRTVLQWKLALASSTISIASGANSRAALIDMSVFVTVIRMSVEDHWQPKVFGPFGIPFLETCRSNEVAIWRLASEVLTTPQQEVLYRAIAAWHRKHPLPEIPTASRAVGFATEVVAADPKESSTPGSVLNLLHLDPLTGLDPAVREIAQARLFAERALFVAQRFPMVLRYQTELLTFNAMDTPAARQLVTNATQVAASVDRVAGVAEKLPDRLAREREEILKAMESQEKTLRPLVNDVKQALDAGMEMSESLTGALKAFDEVMKRLGAGADHDVAPSEPPSAPFRIQDYTQAAAQAEAMAKSLTELLTTLDRAIGPEQLQRLANQVDPAVRRAEAGGREILDYAFRKAVLLLIVVLIAALIYRFLSVRIARAAAPPKKE